MKFVLFYHSLISDWNHGNAHFLRGIASELIARGHEVTVCEPEDAWSVQNLLREAGPGALEAFHRAYPALKSFRYPAGWDPREAAEGADCVIVHEWNPPELAARLGRFRASGGRFRLLFHDTHHRAVTAPDALSHYGLADYDGVLAYGAVLRDLYLSRGWAKRAWTWHEAADTRLFHPRPGTPPECDLIWIGNWGDEERTAELREFLIEPVRRLGLTAQVWGVRYPESGLCALREAGIDYRGWAPNFRVPGLFARSRVTVHIPRGPYARRLPGIPTIRPFEALACGIPLISAPWRDRERLFHPGRDFLVARDGREMEAHLKAVLTDPALAGSLAWKGRQTLLARHTCAHRAGELLSLLGNL